ncbi:IucA/IucC family protein [Saccharococcus caldoxylosilyticus]|uniref:Siderophore synthetase component n=1 Tax=Saccharococcus caldoxylosilyticus TaxID=81408 RepID=A0A150M277_9BACL|nr:IucA/IucC family protein [Parageobacillus caldoxylosilyticus]KYD18545.1 hypothetical protein B4119_4072 [Parageobacillus caldoxylosilyticus]
MHLTERQDAVTNARASRRILKELIDAFLLEDLFSFSTKGKIVDISEKEYYCHISLQSDEMLYEVPLNKEKSFVFTVRRSVLQPYRMSQNEVYLIDKPSKLMQSMEPLDVIKALMDLASDFHPYPTEKLERFCEEISTAIQQTALAMEANESLPEKYDLSLLHTERIASFRDRPFHPTAKAKMGWNAEEYRKYSPEYSREIKLKWVALHRAYIRSGTNADEALLWQLLQEEEKKRLNDAFDKAGVSKSDYMAFPIHPWQKQHVLSDLYRNEIDQKICVPLSVETGGMVATSSLRSLAHLEQRRFHLKLPIGIYSLGASRLLPPRYFINGEKGQQLLQRVKEKNKEIDKQLFLCNEIHWWTFRNKGNDLFSDKPGHLAFQIREYPKELNDSSDISLLPMAAFANNYLRGHRHPFALWLNKKGKDLTSENIRLLFRELCEAFFQLSLRLLSYGIMPELHGQNVVLILDKYRLKGFLLRDHDTVRIFPRWMETKGLNDPEYVIRKDTPNTLIHQSPESFLAYFQTLGIQVNLYSIVDALSTSYGIDEFEFWQEVKESFIQTLCEIDIPDQHRSIIHELFFQRKSWPVKKVLHPLLMRTGSGGGSMPSSIGTIRNPFQ